MNRTRHTNALARERSPYLLQHAGNPVDWLPWGDEAFERARREDRPVFLSIGYSACHWCHVMERESFEDEAVAALLNARFVSVKVDREERPDVDAVYQLAHQHLTHRGGGWPLSMFLTHDRHAFFGGTYFPPSRSWGRPSFLEVLRAMLEAWDTRRDDLETQAREVTAAVARDGDASPEGDVPDDPVRAAAARCLARADRTLGGFGRAPKFPNTMTLDLLVAAAAFQLPDVADDALDHVRVTLDAMARGGVRDHLGGGFARYSTDVRWQVPHFEKMLYDNALLARLYLDGARLLPDAAPRYEAVSREIFAWLAREMTAPDGTFYSAQDADSEGEEGRFFAWTPEAVREAVGDDAGPVCAWFDVTADGNWEHGRSVLWTPRAPDEVAAAAGVTVERLADAVARAKPRLFEARERRAKPPRDDKRLASWNALAIRALADAGASLGDDALLAAATRALHAWRHRAFVDGRLAHAMKDDDAWGAGFLDDHAGMALAAAEVFEATGDASALDFARRLVDVVRARFTDPDTGALFTTADDAEVVLHRTRDPFDHAMPGGAGLALEALQRVAALTGDEDTRAAAARAVAAYAPGCADNPFGLATVCRAVDRARRGAVEVIVVGDRAREDTRAMLRAARGVMLPHRHVVGVADAGEGRAAGLDPHLLEGRASASGGAPMAYVCQGTACEMPARSPEALAATLLRVRARRP